VRGEWQSSEAEIDAVLEKLGLALEPAQPRRKTDWTVAELYKTELPTPAWIVPGLLPAGVASLAGRPKMGKSLLALQLAAAVAVGRAFVGLEVHAGPVLFLALEDPPQRLRLRCRRSAARPSPASCAGGGQRVRCPHGASSTAALPLPSPAVTSSCWPVCQLYIPTRKRQARRSTPGGMAIQCGSATRSPGSQAVGG
jgi:hypothetical protein